MKMGIKKLQESVKEVKDPRRQWGNLRHKLEDILIIGLCSVICQGEDYEDMELFGTERKAWLEGFLELPNGIPDSDTFRRVFERIDPQELSNWLNNWLETERKAGGRLVSVDGKTIRGSSNNEHKAYHVVSAWVGEQGITLGELQVGEKTNEITQVPELLDLLDIKGDIVTADAMSCQKEIAAKIKEKQADYILALKGNQPTMESEVKAYFDDLEQNQEEKSKTASWTSPVEKEHGRIEKRMVTVAPCDWFQDRNQWKGLTSFVRVKRTAIIGEETITFERFYISSLNKGPEEFCALIRGHWSIENQLHWCLDVIFGEDGSRARKDNSPLNMNVLRKTALRLIKGVYLGKRISLQKKRYMAALNPDILSLVISGV